MTPRIAGFPLLVLLGAFAAAAAPARVSGAAEERATISLGTADREQLLAGMRQYLESIQGIVEAAARSDMKAVTAAARKAGAAMVKDVSLSAIVGLPPDFVLASMATHQKFDELADLAQAGGPRRAVLDGLAELLASCNACHTMYRVVAR